MLATVREAEIPMLGNAITRIDERTYVVRADQRQPDLVEVLKLVASPPDIVIDDASHIGSLSRASFELLFPVLVPGGLYCIEDFGTGYWRNWPDGSSYANECHHSGMVGVIKYLVDQVSGRDIKHDRSDFTPLPLTAVHIFNGLVILEKSSCLA